MIYPLYRKTELPGGLRVVTESIPHVRSVAVGVWLTVGSRDENVQNNGISHFLEHMLFKGTRNRNTQQIAESLEAVGGSLDAFTTKELTCYSAHVLDEHLPLSIEVLSDLIINSTLDSLEIEKEKEVILKEIAYYKDTPDDLIFDHFYENIFCPHPLSYEIYGNEGNIRQFDREQLISFKEEQYASNRSVISVAGNIDHEDIVALVQEHFEGLAGNKGRSIVDISQTRGAERVYSASCSQVHVCFGTRAYAYEDERKFAFLILHTMLGGGMSSILFQKIREDLGLAYSIYSFYDFFIDSGIFGIYFSTDYQHIDRILDLVKHEIGRIKRERISQDTLEKMKNQLKGNLLLGLESTVARMNRLARNEIYLDRYYTLDEVICKIDEVTLDNVSRVANDLFKEEDYFTTILKSKNTK
jgi:predicted Zn-dependent peptidase